MSNDLCAAQYFDDPPIFAGYITAYRYEPGFLRLTGSFQLSVCCRKLNIEMSHRVLIINI